MEDGRAAGGNLIGKFGLFIRRSAPLEYQHVGKNRAECRGKPAATEYFKSKTSAKLYDDFKPRVSESMNQVGFAHKYNAMMEKVPAVPFAKLESVGLNHYVTTKALDGLFHMVGQEDRRSGPTPPRGQRTFLKRYSGSSLAQPVSWPSAWCPCPGPREVLSFSGALF